MHKHILKFRFHMVIFLLIIIQSCAKDENPPVEEKPALEQEIPTDERLFHKLIRVENIPATAENSTSTTIPPVFYSLENNTVRTASHQKSRNWDLAFSSLFNSFLSGNNGKDDSNLGKDSEAAGGILILEQKFEDVVHVPAENLFKTKGHLIGTDNLGSFGEGTGWYLYDFDGIIVRDGQEEDKHVAYAIADGLTLKNGTRVSPRTVVIRTAKGHFAKIRMLSCYKDLFDMNQWMRSSPKMFFTFEYILVPKGSTTFDLK